MTFLNATLITGLAAIAVPIVLHLMAKREPRKVVFPSIYFLTKRYESTRTRLRVHRWWLLAMRIAAIAALALALARPAIDRSFSTTWLSIALIAGLGVALLVMATVAIVKGSSRTVGYSLVSAAALAILCAVTWAGYAMASGPSGAMDDASPVAMAIVLDNGPTSAWNTPDDDRNRRMRDLAKWLVTRLPRTSRIAVVDRSRQPIAFSLDPASAISKIDQVAPLQVAQPIASRIENAARLLRTSELTNRQVFVVTDLSRSTWPETAVGGASSTALAESPAIAVHIFDLGEFDAPNRSLSTARVTDATPAKGVSTAVSITLRYQDHSAEPSNAGAEAPRPDASVTAELQMYESDPSLPVIRDGEIRLPSLRNVDRTSLQVAPNSSHELVLTVPPLDVGTHHGRIRLVGDDAFPLDDIRYFTLQVLPSASVLLVGDNDDASRTLGLTMTAPMDSDDPAAEFLIEQISSSDLPVVQVDDFDAVVLIDPPQLTLRDTSLIRFVESGGGLLVCLGPGAGDQSTRDAAVTDLVRRWRVPSPGTFFQIQQPSHPSVSTLAETAGGVPWNEYRVTQYWQVAPSPRYSDTTLISFAGTEHPALLQRRFISAGGTESKSPSEKGREGRCLVVTTTLPDLQQRDARWNDLYGSDAWPAFILVRQMANFITRRSGQSTAGFVGTPHIAEISATRRPMTDTSVDRPAQTDEQVDDVDREDESIETRRLQLFRPGDASPVPVTVDQAANQVVIRDVPTAGTYWLRGNEPGAGFSINLRIDPDALSRIESSRLDQWFGVDGYRLATRQEEVELNEAAASSRISLHSPAMLLALIVFLLEQILGNRFYPSRSGDNSTTNTMGVRAKPTRGMDAA